MKTKLTRIMAAVLTALLALSCAACGMDVPENPATTSGIPTQSTTVPVTEPEELPTAPQPTQPSATQPTEPTEPESPSKPELPEEPEAPTEPEHMHVYSEQITAPACTRPGMTQYICDCGDSYAGHTLPATGHSWSEWKTIRAATQTTEGTAGRTCSACGEEETRTIPKTVPHVHSYTQKVIQSGSCTKDRIVEYTCSCGESYREETWAPGHAFGDWIVVKEATPDEQGLQQMVCAVCGKILSKSYWYCADNDDAEAITQLFIEYINDYRAAEGVGAAKTMEQCTVYAKIRSEQMAAKGVAEHNIDDAREAATQLKYGLYVDPAEYGRPDEPPYYHVNASEAVGMNGGAAVEAIAENFAEGFRNSAPHWSYVGSDPYIAVGMTMSSDGRWFCCIITSEVNLDENPRGY